MVNFCAIVPYLQVRIAEKMDYFQQMEFELSSNIGKTIVNSTNFKPIVDVSHLQLSRDVRFYIRDKARVMKKGTFNCCLLCKSVVSLESFFDLIENVHFVKCDVFLYIEIAISTQIFTQLAELFNINRVEYMDNLDSDSSYLPSFDTVDFFEAQIGSIPAEKLAKVKSKNTDFRVYFVETLSIANLFFKEWFAKQRQIETFKAYQYFYIRHTLMKEMILKDLPNTIIWQSETEPNQEIRFTTTRFSPHRLLKDDIVCSVDRGDKKLLIIVSKCEVIALEYERLEEVVHIGDI